MEESSLNIVSIRFMTINKGDVIARADIHFKGFTLKGFKLLKDDGDDIYVTPPSYLSSHGWRQLFRTDNPEDWNEIKETILFEYQKMAPGNSENLDIDNE
jgi:hypothetical protein